MLTAASFFCGQQDHLEVANLSQNLLSHLNASALSGPAATAALQSHEAPCVQQVQPLAVEGKAYHVMLHAHGSADCTRAGANDRPTHRNPCAIVSVHRRLQ